MLSEPVRPLSLGEVLDRAVTVAVRAFAQLATVFAIALVPLAIAGAFGNNGTAQLVDRMQSLGKLGALTPGALAAIFRAQPVNAADIAQYAFVFLLLPIVFTAAIVIISARFDDAASDTRAALVRGLRRMPSALALLVVWAVLVFAVFVAVTFVFVLIGAALTVPLRSGGIALIAIASILGILAFLFFLALGALAFMLVSVAYCAVALETANPFTATGRSFSRIFRGREFVRAAFAGLAFLVASFVLSLIATGIAGLLFALLHVKVLLIAIELAAGIVSYLAQATFITIYYRDVRLRREGGDLRVPHTA